MKLGMHMIALQSYEGREGEVPLVTRVVVGEAWTKQDISTQSGKVVALRLE